MKKILLFSLIVVMTIFTMGNVYGALVCNIGVQASKTELKKNEEFTVNVNVSNIQSERGIISMGGTLEYDKDSLELISMEGKNGWEKPTDGSTYNAANGKIAITRSGLGKNAETIFTITFKVKNTSKQNLLVGMKDITVADGTKPVKIAQAYQNITITDGTSNPVPDKPTENPTPNPDNKPGTNTPSNSTLGGNTSKNTSNKNIVKNGTLPKAGDNNMVLGMFLIAVVVIAVVFFIKMKLLNKKMGL